MTTLRDEEKRRYIRFKSDPASCAEIDDDSEHAFKPKIVGLLLEYAPMGGCGLIVLDEEAFPISLDKRYRIKIGELEPLKAKIVWRKSIDEGVLKLGCKFLE